MLLRDRRLPSLSCGIARIGHPLWLFDTCVCVDDQPRALAGDAVIGWRGVADDAVGGSPVDALHQRTVSAYRQVVGRPLQVLPGGYRGLNLVRAAKVDNPADDA